MIDIDFELHKVIINTEELLTLGTNYYSDNEYWKELCDKDIEKGKLIHKSNFQLHDKAFLIGNHCFAEAAHFNPLKDLTTWDEWAEGVRYFPFSGHYLNLGIAEQKNKKISERLLGTVGEIISGLLFNTRAKILVRPIQKFPDFIGKLENEKGWAFLEAKCYQKLQKDGGCFNNRVPVSKYKEVCTDAIKEIKNEKSLVFFASFTEVIEINPLRLKQTIIHIEDKDRATKLKNPIKVPLQYLEPIIESCINSEIKDFFDDNEQYSSTKSLSEKKLKEEIIKNTRNRIETIEELNGMNNGEILNDENFNKVLDRHSKNINKSIDKIKKNRSLLNFKNFINTPGKMTKGPELDKDQAFYTQDLGQFDKVKNNSQSHWSINHFERNQSEFFIYIGNSFIGICDKSPQPLKIDTNNIHRSYWK